MIKCIWLRIPLLIGMLFVLLACDFSFGSDEDEEDLRLQLTVQAMQMTQEASSKKVSDPKFIPQNPVAPVQSSGDSEVSGSSASQGSSLPCNASKFVSETIPDGTTFQPGEGFAKTWTLRNVGSCKWNENYVFEFEEGTRMGGESAIKANTVIEPNETITFKVNLKAPDAAGDYTGVWRLKSSDGEKFGKYWVVIKVGGEAAPAAPAGAFAVTSVQLTNVTFPDPGQMTCPYAIGVTFAITASGPGTVTYNIVTQNVPELGKSVVFKSAGTQTISGNSLIFVDGKNNDLSLYIDQPNHQTFGPFEIFAICE